MKQVYMIIQVYKKMFIYEASVHDDPNMVDEANVHDDQSLVDEASVHNDR